MNWARLLNRSMFQLLEFKQVDDGFGFQNLQVDHLDILGRQYAPCEGSDRSASLFQ
jgi:hypothetical protein